MSFNFTAEDATILATVIPAVAAAWHIGITKVKPTVIKAGDKVVEATDKVITEVAPALTDAERAELTQAVRVVNKYGAELGVAPLTAPVAAPARQV